MRPCTACATPPDRAAALEIRDDHAHGLRREHREPREIRARNAEIGEHALHAQTMRRARLA
ncbi:hypothetical protein ACLKMY_04115 [Paraburkholderia mimosarum]|uniref:hypothetical protein n=1 Tax=Paraburkholderia mimosarum TaxID=312026 RepID=UPI0004811C08